MTRKTRALLFFILVILFLLAAPSTLLYSWGYRFDFEEKKITQTGGFYFKVWPKSSQIVIDGKPLKKTDFFFGAAYLDNILPKSYQVEIQREGYHSWKKILEVKETQVTDAKNVVLVPQNPNFSTLSQNVEEFFASPDQKKMILKETEGKSFSLKLLELDSNIKSQVAKKSDLGTSSVEEFVDSFFEVQEPETEEIKMQQVEAQELPEGELSPDQRKLAFISNSEVWVLFQKEELSQPQKAAGERLLVARFSEKISQVFWLTSHYLVFTVGDQIKIAEIDDRDGINIVDFAEFPAPKIFFNQTDKKLYILSEGNLYSSERLLP